MGELESALGRRRGRWRWKVRGRWRWKVRVVGPRLFEAAIGDFVHAVGPVVRGELQIVARGALALAGERLVRVLWAAGAPVDRAGGCVRVGAGQAVVAALCLPGVGVVLVAVDRGVEELAVGTRLAGVAAERPHAEATAGSAGEVVAALAVAGLLDVVGGALDAGGELGAADKRVAHKRGALVTPACAVELGTSV